MGKFKGHMAPERLRPKLCKLEAPWCVAHHLTGLRVSDLRFGGLWFVVCGLGLGVECFEFCVWGLGFGVWGFGIGVWGAGSGVGVQGLGFKV